MASPGDRRSGVRPGAPAVQKLVAATFGGDVGVGRIERLAPWWVWRVELSGGTGVARSVIAKGLRVDAGGRRGDLSQLLTERASLEFLAELELAVAPRLLGADHEAGLVLLEDLTPRAALSELLRAGGPEAMRGLRAFARTKGALHAGTVGRDGLYYRRRARLGPVDPSRDRHRVLSEPATWSLPAVDVLGVGTGWGVEADVARAGRALFEEGPFVAFSNGDPGANNFLVEGDDGRLIDWEFGGYRHALLDASSLWVPGPAWLSVTEPAMGGVDEAYRSALAAGVPAATDDATYGLALAAACMASAIERLLRLPRLDGRPVGHDSRAQMVSTLESAARVARSTGTLVHLAGWAEAVAAALRRRWPDADRDFTNGYLMRE